MAQEIEKIIENLMFLPVDVEPAPSYVAEQINSVRFDNLLYCDYRNTHRVPFMSGSDKEWWPIANEFPDIKKWLEEAVFPFTGRTRTIFLVTPPNHFLPPHIDTNNECFYTKLEHKFRYVLDGNVDDLEFLTDNGTIKPKSIDKPFVMSGKWPHQMRNTHTRNKITLTIGSPWDPTPKDKDYVKHITKAYEKYEDYYLSKEGVNLPEDYEKYFQIDPPKSPRFKTSL